MIKAAHHVQISIPVGAEDKAREFYCGLLGMTEIPKPPVLAARGGCWFRTGPVQLHLGIEAEFRPAKKAHPALVVDDLDELSRRCVDAGIEVRDGDGLDGYRQGYVDDPFGNRIELLEAQ